MFISSPYQEISGDGPVVLDTSTSKTIERHPAGKKDPLFSRFDVAIIEPEFGINVGYLARTAANFGINKLLVVSRKKLNQEDFSKGELFAAHGRPLIDSLEYVNSIKALKRRYKLLIGTTAIAGRRRSNLTRKTQSPEECARLVFRRLGRKAKQDWEACFVFGRDTTGLTNEELKECDYTLTIKTHSPYQTLNVSHAAAIVFYIFANFANSNRFAEQQDRVAEMISAISLRRTKDRTVSLFVQLAEASEFQSFKLGLLRETLNRMVNRSDPSLRELYLLMGLASKAKSKITRLSSRVS